MTLSDPKNSHSTSDDSKSSDKSSDRSNKISIVISPSSHLSLRKGKGKKAQEKFLLESLKKNKDEVIHSKFIEKTFSWKPTSSYNSVRDTYRLLHESKRKNYKKNWMDKALEFPDYVSKRMYLSCIQFLRSPRRKLIMNMTDLLVDFTFALLFAIQISFSVNKLKLNEFNDLTNWLKTYNTMPIFALMVVFSIWNLISFVIRFISVIFYFCIY